MGFFSGIGKAIKGVVGAIADPISSITGIASDIMGIGAPFMEQQSVAGANAANAQLAREQMAFQQAQNQKAMNFTRSQDLAANRLTTSLQNSNFRFNRAQSEAAMGFSERMAGTQYQRAVKDLSAAGLNPMLAYSNGGAAAPSGTAVGGSGGSGTAGSGVSSAGAMARMEPTLRAQSLASAQQARQQSAMVSNINADTANKLLSATDIQAGIQLKGSQAYESTTRGHVNQATESKILKTVGPLLDQIKASAEQSRASAVQIDTQNLAIKDLMSNPQTRFLAPILQLLLK